MGNSMGLQTTIGILNDYWFKLDDEPYLLTSTISGVIHGYSDTLSTNLPRSLYGDRGRQALTHHT